MRRRALILLSLLASAAFLAGGAGAQEQSTPPGDPILVEVGGARFPDRAYILGLPPGAVATPGQVHVTENGTPVTELTVVPVSATKNKAFGIVLAIDTSNSMRGAPLAGALEAARAFAARKNPNQQVAVVLFNDQVTTLLPFTGDGAAIERALASTPITRRGTRLFDGVDAALRLLQKQKIDSGAVVVLSDGADTGSQVLPAALVERAKSTHTRIFAVAFRSHAFKSGPLSDFASGTGGRYTETTSPEGLTKIYDSLGAQLAREYVIRYRSLAKANERVTVVAEIDGVSGTAIAGYETPALAINPAPPYHPSLPYTFWRSGLAMLAVSLFGGLLVGAALAVVLRPTNRSLRARMSEFVTIYLPQRGKGGAPLPERVFVGAERSLERTRWWTRFKNEVVFAGVNVPPVQLVLWTVVATVAAMLLLYVMAGSVLLSVVGLAIPLFVRMFIKRRVERVRSRFAEQLPDNLQVLASALRAGHSLVGALSVVVDDAPEPSRSEFRAVVADEQLGVPLDQSLTTVSERMENRDLEQVALVASLQRETGGNTAEVLDRVTETIRARFELRRLVKTLTAQGRMSRWVVSFLPVVLFLAISLLNPKYMDPLFSHTSGRILLGVCVVMIVAGSLVIRRIVNFKV
jgi:tight adherence protein B